MPCRSAGQDFAGFGIRFTKHGGGSDIDYFNKGHWYTDPNSPTSAMTMQNYLKRFMFQQMTRKLKIKLNLWV